jgi:putative addiction module killer protein
MTKKTTPDAETNPPLVFPETAPCDISAAADTVKLFKPPHLYDVVEYLPPNGKSHFQKWFNKLPSQHATKVDEAIRRMETGNFGDHHGVGEGVFEHRIFNPALRIYYGLDGGTIVVLLTGGDKHTQDKDVRKAKKLWQAFKTEKQAANKIK